MVAKLLYLCKRGRPDIEPTVAFLCTRVAKSDVEDWKKLIRLLSFLKKTIDDTRIIGASCLNRLSTWIDAAHAVHEDMKGQTGGATSYGIGILNSKSSKQKLNTRSSTESELVGVSEYIPHCIWYMNFLKCQGYDLENNVVYQDNVSAIRMEKNGRNSCTGNSRHIDIRYFFIKDRIEKGEVTVAYCPTELMLADFYTKPLQGSLFNFFRRIIMGYDDISSILPSSFSKLEECVGKSDIETSNLEKESKNKQKNKASSTGELTRKKVSFIGSEDVRAYGRVGSKSSYSEQEKSNNDIVMSSHSTTANSVRGMSNSKGSRTYAEACSTNNIKQANPM